MKRVEVAYWGLRTVAVILATSLITLISQDSESRGADDTFSHPAIELIALIPPAEFESFQDKSLDELNEVEKKVFLENIVVCAKTLRAFRYEFENHPLSDVAEPIFQKDKTLFEEIRDAARDVSFFPVNSLYAHRSGGYSNPLRILLTYEQFVPFCKFREFCYNASEDEVRECYVRMSEFSRKELAFALSAFHIYLIKNYYIPNQIGRSLRKKRNRAIKNEFRAFDFHNSQDILIGMYFYETANQMDESFVETLESAVEACQTDETVIFEDRYDARLRGIKFDELSREDCEAFRESTAKLYDRLSRIMNETSFLRNVYANDGLRFYLQKCDSESRNWEKRQSFPFDDYAVYSAVFSFVAMETQYILFNDDYRSVLMRPEDRTELRLIRKYFANQTPDPTWRATSYHTPYYNELSPHTLGDVATELIQQRKEFGRMKK